MTDFKSIKSILTIAVTDVVSVSFQLTLPLAWMKSLNKYHSQGYIICKSSISFGIDLISGAHLQHSDSFVIVACLVYLLNLARVLRTQLSWAVLFTLGLIWNPLGRQDLVDDSYENEWLWYFLHGMLNDGTGWWPLPPLHLALTISALSVCFTDHL